MSRTERPTIVVKSYEAKLDPELESLAAEYPNDVELVEAKGFGATQFTAQAVIHLAPVLPVVITWIRAKRHMSLKLGGIEITGMTPREIERVLRAAADGDVLRALELAKGPVEDTQPNEGPVEATGPGGE
jgi:hypothetical protein